MHAQTDRRVFSSVMICTAHSIKYSKYFDIGLSSGIVNKMKHSTLLLLEELSNDHTWSESNKTALDSSTILNDSLDSINFEYIKVMKDSENFLNSPLAGRLSEPSASPRKDTNERECGSFGLKESIEGGKLNLKLLGVRKTLKNDEQLYHELNEEMDLVQRQIESSIQNQVEYKPRRSQPTASGATESIFRAYTLAMEACQTVNQELGTTLQDFDMSKRRMIETIEEYKRQYGYIRVDLVASDKNDTDILSHLIRKSDRMIKDNRLKL